MVMEIKIEETVNGSFVSIGNRMSILVDQAPPVFLQTFLGCLEKQPESIEKKQAVELINGELEKRRGIPVSEKNWGSRF